MVLVNDELALVIELRDCLSTRGLPLGGEDPSFFPPTLTASCNV